LAATSDVRHQANVQPTLVVVEGKSYIRPRKIIHNQTLHDHGNKARIRI